MKFSSKFFGCNYRFLLLSASLFILMAPAISTPVGGSEEITTAHGFGVGRNKFSWSSTTFSSDTNIYIDTINVNSDIKTITEYISRIEAAPNQDLAYIEVFRMSWSGSPIAPSEGGESWRYYGTDWERVYEAPTQKCCFLRNDYQQLNGPVAGTKYIYTVSANGPDGPLPGDQNIGFFPYIGTEVFMSEPFSEPVTILLMGFGLAGLAGYWRRKFKKK
jgi:hypothetical protein